MRMVLKILCFLISIFILLFPANCAFHISNYSVYGESNNPTITFSATKSVQNSISSPELSGVSVSVSGQLSLIMPFSVLTQSNTNMVTNGTTAVLNVTLMSASAEAKITMSISVSIAGISKSFSKTITGSFISPIGSSQISFTTVSLQVGSVPFVGDVTLDLTPRASLVGQVSGKISTRGSAEVDVQDLSWTSQTKSRTVNVMFKGNTDVDVVLHSTTMNIVISNFELDLGATITVLGSSHSIDIGTIPLPISTDITSDGSPNSVIIAHFSAPSSPSGSFQFTFPPVSLSWLFIAITVLAIINIIIVTVKKRRQRNVMSGGYSNHK